MKRLDPERSRKFAMWFLSHNFGPTEQRANDSALATVVWDRPFANPIGLPAGFDRNAVAIDGEFRWGFGFTEVGTVTLRPQPGNERKRLFKLESDDAIVNRMGLPSKGAAAVAQRIESRKRRDRVVGASLAGNTGSKNPIQDFRMLVQKLAPGVDFLTIDISCPNTKDSLQFSDPQMLLGFLYEVVKTRDQLCEERPTLLLVKFSPDEAASILEQQVEACVKSGIDGFVATNTTTKRPETLTSTVFPDRGGLSGRPLFAKSTEVVRRVYELTDGKIPIIGVGGISSGRDAYLKIRAGASLVQMFSVLFYEPPSILWKIKRELAECIKADGFSSVSEAVGADHQIRAATMQHDLSSTNFGRHGVIEIKQQKSA